MTRHLQYSVLLALLAYSSPALAQSPADKLIGNWRSKSTKGEVCSRLLRWVEYEFDQDGYYSITSELSNLGPSKLQRAKGTYEVKADTITGNVDGVVVGPFKFAFHGDELLIFEKNPFCEIRLQRR